uniref:CSON000845 protein n=1 Tax=Culicoides sonorensis TaxID=179676 RepID=A0A336MFY7_CULSO
MFISTTMPSNFCYLITVLSVFIVLFLIQSTCCYDPTDKELDTIIPKPGEFEAFYPREMHGIPNSAARAPHGHGSFFKHRNPALVDVKNAAAYGFRFDGKRRFNFD